MNRELSSQAQLQSNANGILFDNGVILIVAILVARTFIEQYHTVITTQSRLWIGLVTFKTTIKNVLLQLNPCEWN